MRKGLGFKLFEEILYKLMHTTALSMLQQVFQLVLSNENNSIISFSTTLLHEIYKIHLLVWIQFMPKKLTEIRWKNGFAGQKLMSFGSKSDDTNNKTSYFKLNGRPSIIKYSWTYKRWRIYLSETIFPTAVYFG